MDKPSFPAHIGKLRNAVDFIVLKGTPIFATADDIITYINFET
jgi:murein DD-endopeptidase MepM/ murein hydrolase activator NlpD